MGEVTDLAAAASGLFFLAAAFGKIDSWAAWSRLTGDLPTPRSTRFAARFAIPVAETTAGVLSFLRPAAGLGLATFVLLSFAVAVWLIEPKLSGRECTCFGAIAPAQISKRLALRNLLLAAVVGSAFSASLIAKPSTLPALDVFAAIVIGASIVLVLEYARVRQASRAESTT